MLTGRAEERIDFMEENQLVILYLVRVLWLWNVKLAFLMSDARGASPHGTSRKQKEYEVHL